MSANVFDMHNGRTNKRAVKCMHCHKPVEAGTGAGMEYGPFAGYVCPACDTDVIAKQTANQKQLVAVGNAQGVTAFDPGYFTAADEADRQAEINFARYGG